MSISISSTVASILASSTPPTPTVPAPTPSPSPLLKIASTTLSSATKTIITSTIDVTTESGNSGGSLLREGAGVALNAVYVVMLTLLGLCILFCIVSSACWCFMKHRQDNRFNNFTSEPSTQRTRQDGEQEP